jgi:hypothetical protein
VNRARELDPEFCDVEHQEAVLQVGDPRLVALQCARPEGTFHFDSAVIDSAVSVEVHEWCSAVMHIAITNPPFLSCHVLCSCYLMATLRLRCRLLWTI